MDRRKETEGKEPRKGMAKQSAIARTRQQQQLRMQIREKASKDCSLGREASENRSPKIEGARPNRGAE